MTEDLLNEYKEYLIDDYSGYSDIIKKVEVRVEGKTLIEEVEYYVDPIDNMTKQEILKYASQTGKIVCKEI